MPSSKHSKLGASGAHRWMACPGSVALSESIPPEDRPGASIYAAEGTVAHSIAEAMLKRKPGGVAPAFPSDIEQEGHRIEVTDEMLAAVNVYVKLLHREAKGALSVHTEVKFHLVAVHPDLWGTADRIHVYDNLLRVYDYKHGKGVPVDAEDNVQLMYYALGALYETNAPVAEVEVVIVQPRCDKRKETVRRWRFKTVELIDFAADLRDAAKRTEAADAPLVPGRYCWWCPAGTVGVCPEVAKQKHEKRMEQALTEFDPV